MGTKRIICFALVLGLCLCFLSHPVLAFDDWIMETDNHDATFFGTWGTSTARILYYGDNYRWALCSGSTAETTATATFTAGATLDVSGYYTVFARWVVDPNRTTGAPYQIFKNIADATPIATVTRNQEVNGGEWRVLGTYFFYTGNVPKVVLGNNCVTEANGANVIADAVRWVKENIDAGDTVDEPGIDWNRNDGSVTIASDSYASPTTVISQSITCPRGGYVLAMANGQSNLEANSAISHSFINYSLSTATSWDSNYSQITGTFNYIAGGGEYMPFSLSRIDNCSSTQTITYYLVAYRGDNASPTASVSKPTINLLYFPTHY